MIDMTTDDVTQLPDTKMCSSCKKLKPFAEFYKTNATLAGLTSACRTCISERDRKHREAQLAPGETLSQTISYAQWRRDNPPEPGEKRCPICKESKPFSDFGIKKDRKDGTSTYCKKCANEKLINIDPELRKNRLERRAEWLTDNSESIKVQRHKHYLLTTYGLTLEEWEKLLEQQGNRCALCGGDSPGRDGIWNVDHDHETGRIRGLLCLRCNVMLGYIEKDWQMPTIEELIDYMKRGVIHNAS